MGKLLLPLIRVHPDGNTGFTCNLSTRNLECSGDLGRSYLEGSRVKTDFTEKEQNFLRSMCLAFLEVWLILGGRPHTVISRDESAKSIGGRSTCSQRLCPQLDFGAGPRCRVMDLHLCEPKSPAWHCEGLTVT